MVVFLAHVPWNLVLLAGVRRSAGWPEVGPDTVTLARATVFVWVVLLSVL